MPNGNALGVHQRPLYPAKTITYKHNALNQRVAKLVNGEVVEKYLWKDLTTLLAIYDKDDNLKQRFEYADSRMPISMTSNGQKYYLHYDQVGSLRAVTDTNHNIVKEIVYDTFGNILSDSNPSFTIPFGFAGGLYGQDTKLTRFGYRDYDAYTGKWTAKDPIGFSGGDSNLYGYVLGDPVSGFDASGLFFYNNTDKPVKVRPEDGGIDIVKPHSLYCGWIDGFKPSFYNGDWHKISDYSSAILTENRIIELGITSYYYPHCDTTIDDCKAEYPGRKPHDYWPSK